MKTIVEMYCDLPINIRKPLWQIWHRLIIAFDKEKSALFMNYGYQSLNEDEQVNLNEEDEKNRYCIQLYDHVVNKVDLKNKQVLEVGSGRGGGASYITRYYKPASYTAMDISSSVVKFCDKHYKISGLSFAKGVAEDLPFENNMFDFVVNVESARCYGNLKTFFSEVHRVLNPNGRFLFADMIRKGEEPHIRKLLLQSGFEIVSEQNIAPNVVKALDKDHERRQAAINKRIPGFLKKSFYQFAGTKGTERYESFANGKMEYWTYIMKKETDTPTFS